MSKFYSLILITALSLMFVGQALCQKKYPLTVETLHKIPRISQLVVSPDALRAAFTVKTLNMDTNSSLKSVWVVTFKSGQTRRLTNGEVSDWSPRWVDNKRVAFLSKRSGTSQVWSMGIDDGRIEQLTNLPVSIENFQMAPDGKHMAAVAAVYPQCHSMECNRKAAEIKNNKTVKAVVTDDLLYRVWNYWRNDTLDHILWISLDGGEPRDLTPGNFQAPPFDLGGNNFISISPDSKEVAFAANVSEQPALNTNNDVFIVNVKSGKPVNITKDNKACDGDPQYSPNGKYIAYTAMARPGYESDRRVLTLYNRETQKLIPLTNDHDFEVRWHQWRPDSNELIIASPHRGGKAIFRITVPSGLMAPVALDRYNTEPQYLAGGVDLAFLSQSASEPTEVFTISLRGTNKKRLTRLTEQAIKNTQMGKVDQFEFKGADADKVHGYLVKPPGFDPKKQYPLLMLIHGGPHGSFGDRFHPRWNIQMFASTGFVVAAVNFHGSRGYGQKFSDAVSGDWGGKAYEDIMLGVDYLVKTHKFIQKDNVSAAGASYGGFMINWILGHTDRFRALVSHAGVYDQVSMYGATEELWFPEWEFKGTPWSNPEHYKEFSPSTYVENFKTPTLVIHGEHDYRVPYTQSLQLFSALQRQGVESKLLFFPDETHFVQKPHNARLWWGTVIDWLSNHAGLTPDKSTKKRRAIKKIAR